MSYLVITKSDGKYFKEYSPRAPGQYYAHKEKTVKAAQKSVEKFARMGVYAKIYKDWRI